MSKSPTPLERNSDASSLRTMLATRDYTVGAWCTVPSSITAEVMAEVGFDWICLDLQHGFIGFETMVVMLQILHALGTKKLVRVPWNDPPAVMRALDAGADGIIVPMVNSVEEAKAAAGACRYPNRGYRSWGPLLTSLRDPGYSPDQGNRDAVCLVMAETPAAIDAVEGILNVPGIDGIYVGPWDLSISISGGHVNPAGSPRDLELIEVVATSCGRRNRVAGISCRTPADVATWHQLGYRFFSIASDISLIQSGGAAALEAMRAELESRQ